jgi:hypothetical protein
VTFAPDIDHFLAPPADDELGTQLGVAAPDAPPEPRAATGDQHLLSVQQILSEHFLFSPSCP